MMASRHHGSRPSPRQRGGHQQPSRSEHQYHHYYHRLAIMTTTHHDNDNGDQDDIMRGDDFSPHPSLPGTENPENPNEFHKNIDNIKRSYVSLKKIKISEMNVRCLQDQKAVETTTSSTASCEIQQITYDLEYVEQVNFLVTSSCARPNRTASRKTYYVSFNEPTSAGNVPTVETSIRCRSSGTTVHLPTEHCTSTTSMNRDLTTTAVSKVDTRRLCLRDDTSCHR